MNEYINIEQRKQQVIFASIREKKKLTNILNYKVLGTNNIATSWLIRHKYIKMR